MNQLSDLIKEYQLPLIQNTEYKNFRDELVSKITDGINATRIGTQYKPITKKMVAIRINKNPFLAKRDGEVELLYKECIARGNYSKFFWATK